MAHNLKFMGAILLMFQLAFTGVMAQPKFPSAFSAQVTTYYDGYQNSAEVFVDYTEDKALMVTNLGILNGFAGQAYTYFSGSGAMTYRYLEAFDYCTDENPTYLSFPQLNMLGNATYKRSHMFMTNQVDVWEYEAMYDNTYSYPLQIAFLSSDYETPVYLIVYGFTIVVDSFNNTPPSYSQFDIPDQCFFYAKKAKNEGGKAKKKFPFNGHNIFKTRKF